MFKAGGVVTGCDSGFSRTIRAIAGSKPMASFETPNPKPKTPNPKLKTTLSQARAPRLASIAWRTSMASASVEYGLCSNCQPVPSLSSGTSTPPA